MLNFSVGLLDGAIVLGKLAVSGRLTKLDNSRTRAKGLLRLQ